MRTKVTDLHPFRRWILKYTEGYIHYVGFVYLNNGTVIINRLMDPLSCGDIFTELETNHNGKIYKTRFDRQFYSERFCTTLAKRFMSEVIELSKKGK